MSARLRPLRAGPLSRLLDPRPAWILAALLVLLAAAMLLAVGFGTVRVPLDGVLAALTGGGTRAQRVMVIELRLPRVLAALEAGVGLGVAGFLMQGATRNPLASPGILGTVGGAGLGAVLFLAVLSDSNNALTVPILWQPAAAALGSLVALAALFLLAGPQAASPTRLLLYGIALAALAKAGITLLMLLGPVYRASQALQWLAGSVHAATWDEARIVALAGLPPLVAAACLARPMSLMALDDESARAGGLPVAGMRLAAFGLAALLASVPVAFFGGIGFVGLMAPHLARMLLGSGPGTGLVGAALVGALIVLGADLLVRVAFGPMEIPTGAVTALLGAPYMLHLLLRRTGSHG